MKALVFSVTVALGCLLGTTVSAGDKPPMGLTTNEKPGRVNMQYDSVSFSNVLMDVTRTLNVNIITPPGFDALKVTCSFIDVEWQPALATLVGAYECVFREASPGSNVFTIRPLTVDELRAAALKRFYDALRKEGFTEEQSFQILLQSMREERSR